MVLDLLSGSDGNGKRRTGWRFNICTEMEAAREPVGRREASQVSWKPSISIAVTSALSFHAKRIPPASPIRWPFVPTSQKGDVYDFMLISFTKD